jgi:hypothetical protein
VGLVSGPRHAFLAGLAAEHVSAVLPELGEARLRDGLARLARSAARGAGRCSF